MNTNRCYAIKNPSQGSNGLLNKNGTWAVHINKRFADESYYKRY